jgi:phospholipid/cholesterol/gamma-HCH transport system ATP-binding protein
VVSHDVEETVAISDYIYLLSGGKVVGQGTPAELGDSGSEWAQQFLQGLPDGPVPFHYSADDYAEDLLMGRDGEKI